MRQLLIISCLVCFCVPQVAHSQNPMDKRLQEKAQKLAHNMIITDGHVDLPYRLTVQNFRLEKEFLGIPIETDKGDFDYVRAKEGGLDAPFMSIYIPSRYQKEGGAKELAIELIDMVNGIIEAHPDKFAPGLSPTQIEHNFELGLVSLPMGMENGAPIERIEDVNYFHKRGIRYVTLTHSKDNQICDSSYDDARTWGGLSEFGKLVVKEMNRVGMMIDISHVTDETFYQVLQLTKAPVIASHSSARKFTPDFERNMSDDMIRMLPKNGGVIMINFGSTFLDGEIEKQRTEMRQELAKILEEKGLARNDEAAKPIIEDFQKSNPRLYSDVKRVADHIDHVVALAGIDHVGLGSDFDGVGDSLPTGLKDVSQYPNLINTLLQRGYSAEDIKKICYDNLARVWRQVEEVANESQHSKSQKALKYRGE